jgi:deoxyribonuclease-4
MADRPRFGPAGVPPLFRLAGAVLSDVPRLLVDEGLDAFEYEAVYWGKRPQIKKADAEKLGLKATENDVWLSVHGSYFINLCGRKVIVDASKRRLIACATAADWMRAHVVVFHPGFYGERSRTEAFRLCSQAMTEVVEELRALGVKNVKIGPETMGRRHQLGSLEEILGLCREVEQTQLVVDWSHLHAREAGALNAVEDFRRVVLKIEEQLGTEAVKNMHCHFTKIEFTVEGEKRHHSLREKRFGPDFRKLAKVIAEFRLNPVMISESPMLDVDAARMRDILQEEWSRV